ncbi:hypothetical protein FACS1894139_07140 [Planctomycetales bacterium]|nr:hypothetical protein FACS1894139_07140 [Planctomycetales bacterium]
MATKIMTAFFDAPEQTAIAATLTQWQMAVLPVAAVSQLIVQLWAQPAALVFKHVKPEFPSHLAGLKKVAPQLKIIAVLPPDAPPDVAAMLKKDGVFPLTAPLRIPDLLTALAQLLPADTLPPALREKAAHWQNTQNAAATAATDNSEKNKPQFAAPEVLQKRLAAIAADGRLLGDVAEIFTGVMPRENFRRFAAPTPDWRAVLTAGAVDNFYVTAEREYYLLRRDAVSRVPHPDEYAVPEKVLVRRAANPLTAALDTTQLPYNGELYGIITVTGLAPGYLACVLNSRYAKFFFAYQRPAGAGLRGVYLTKYDLEALPLVIAAPKEQKYLSDLARQISAIPPDETQLLSRAKLLNEINKQIFHLYGFGNKEISQLAELRY